MQHHLRSYRCIPGRITALLLICIWSLLTLAGCQGLSHTTALPPDLMPVVAPQVAALTPVIAQAQAFNRRARDQIANIAIANLPMQKPKAIATLVRQGLTLNAAAASVAALHLEARREDQAAQQAARLAAATTLQLAQARQQTTLSKQRYDTAWLGGKAHRLIRWIVGISLIVLILDFLADAFLGVGFNPLEWIAGLGHLAKLKV